MLSAAEGSRHVPALHGTATRSRRDTVGLRQGQHFPRDGEDWLWKVVWAETQNVGSSEWSGGPSSDGLGCRRPWQRCDISTLPWSEALQAPELTRGRGPRSCHQPGEGGACRSRGEPPQQSGRTFPEAKAAQGVTPSPPHPVIQQAASAGTSRRVEGRTRTDICPSLFTAALFPVTTGYTTRVSTDKHDGGVRQRNAPQP